jgi:hypothetical protein
MAKQENTTHTLIHITAKRIRLFYLFQRVKENWIKLKSSTGTCQDI